SAAAGLLELRTWESRHAPAVCCSAWFGGRTDSVPRPPLLQLQPALVRRGRLRERYRPGRPEDAEPSPGVRARPPARPAPGGVRGQQDRVEPLLAPAAGLVGGAIGQVRLNVVLQLRERPRGVGEYQLVHRLRQPRRPEPPRPRG